MRSTCCGARSGRRRMTTSPVDKESVRVSDILELLIGGLGGPIAGHGSQGHALNAEKARRYASIWVKQALGEGSDAARDQGGRSEERRVGNECVSKVRYRWSAEH